MTSDHLADAYDVFVDLSSNGLDDDAEADYLQRLSIDCGYGQSAGDVTVLGRNDSDMAAAWRGVVTRASRRRRHLVIILGPVLADNGIVPPLLEALGRDPLFGSAQPRFACSRTDDVWSLSVATKPGDDVARTTRGALSRLPLHVVTAEWLSAVTVIRRDVVSAIVPARGFGSLKGALAYNLTQARRRGFRNVVANNVVVPSSLAPADLYPMLPANDAATLEARFPDIARAAADNASMPQRRLEPLLSAAFFRSGVTGRLLLNCRGLGRLHNGTSKCVLGMLDGFAALNAPWRIDVAADVGAIEFHGLARRYPQFELVSGDIRESYAAAVTLNQPWTVETVAELHRYAFLIGFNILDTIGWDILYPAPERLDWAWRFIARHADLLLYISSFSRDRFRARFPVAVDVSERVVHLSLLIAENVSGQLQGLPIGDHVLLFGNSYDHKGVEPTLRLLLDAFPLQEFTVFGGEGLARPRLRIVQSGDITEDEVHRLVATARAVVYPSFYEGFGLPVVESLAYGRPILVRRSELWTEIAAHSRLPGQLLEFDDPLSLIEMLGGVLSGSVAAGLPFGTALAADQAPSGWREAAAKLLQAIEDRLQEGGIEHWQARDEALRTGAA